MFFMGFQHSFSNLLVKHNLRVICREFRIYWAIFFLENVNDRILVFGFINSLKVSLIETFNHLEMHCAIWDHLCNLKNVKNTHGGLLLVKLQDLACNFAKSNTPSWVVFKFLNCTNVTKSRNHHILNRYL